MVWSPLNDNDYKTKRRYSNLDKGALKASLLVYIGTKKNPSEDGLMVEVTGLEPVSFLFNNK